LYKIEELHEPLKTKRRRIRKAQNYTMKYINGDYHLFGEIIV
jgi:hypothetical protein